MKKFLTLILALAMVLTMFAGAAMAEGEPLKVICLLNGTLGDKSFFDSAAAGIKLINENIENVDATYVEMGYDSSVWATTLADVSEGDYDIIIVGTYQLQDALQEIAPQYPDNHYIIFDSNVDYSAGDCDNVYSISFKQNEASYLAGAYPEANTVLVAGGAEEEHIQAACEAFQANLPEKKFLPGGSVLTDADTIRKVGQSDLTVLVEHTGVSSYSGVIREAETVQSLKGTLAGALVIED